MTMKKFICLILFHYFWIERIENKLQFADIIFSLHFKAFS